MNKPQSPLLLEWKVPTVKPANWNTFVRKKSDRTVSFAWPIDLTDSIIDRQQNLKAELLGGFNKFLVWQNEAKEAIVSVLLDGLMSVNREQGVLGSVFLGWPTGVGKTELARTLARILLGNPDAFVKISCENMPHPANIEKLTGSSAGYVGYGDTPMMADTLVHAGYQKAKEQRLLHPLVSGYSATNFSIVLVDEVEKAHPDIPNAFLNAIQSGSMQMSSGKEGNNSPHSKGITHSRLTDLQNTLFIFTSNVGEHSIQHSNKNSIGFTKPAQWGEQDAATFRKELEKRFAPEFIGRMDAVVRLHSLTEEQIRQIFSIHVDRMNGILQKKNYSMLSGVVTTPDFIDYSLRNQEGWLVYGARGIERIVKRIGSQVGYALESGRIPTDSRAILEFDIRDNKPLISFHHQNVYSGKSVRTVGTDLDQERSREKIRGLVEGKLNRHSKKVREVVQEYVQLINSYDTGFRLACEILEKRLRGYGFSSKDILDLQTSAFVDIYHSVEQPENYEVIVRDGNYFKPVWFRAIEKYLRSAIIQKHNLSGMYNTIRILLDRPMTKEESSIISQHIHRLLQQKYPK